MILLLSTHPDGQFGFIVIGAEDERTTGPRIYFNFEHFNDETFRPRKGYGVSFTVTSDESDRLAAKDVILTADGRVTATEREATLLQRGGSEQKPKARRARVPPAVDTRTVNLTVTGEGLVGSRNIEAKLGDTLGKLKHLCITAFESENIALQVYHSDGRLMTKDILGSMQDGEALRLAPKAEV
jgi:hypothetical protein